MHIWQTPNQISSCDNHTLFWLEPGRQLRSGRKSAISAAGRLTFFSYLCHTCCRANALASWNTWKPLVSPSINWVWQHGWVILGIKWKCYVTSIALRNVREYYYGPLTISPEITICPYWIKQLIALLQVLAKRKSICWLAAHYAGHMVISNGNNHISIQFGLQNEFSFQELLNALWNLLEVEVDMQWYEEGWVSKGLGCASQVGVCTSRVWFQWAVQRWLFQRMGMRLPWHLLELSGEQILMSQRRGA